MKKASAATLVARRVPGCAETLPAAASHKRYLMQFEKEWLEGYDLSLPAAHCGAVAYLSGEEAERLELLLSLPTDKLHKALLQDTVRTLATP